MCTPPAPASTQPTLAPENPSSTPATGDPATVGASAKTATVRPPVLGLDVLVLGRLEGCTADRLPGNGRRMASPGLPPVLALEVAEPSGPAAHQCRTPPTYSPPGAAENALWGVPRIQAELRLLGCDAAESTVGQIQGAAVAATVADLAFLPRQPRRLPGLGRFLRRAHGDIPAALWFPGAAPRPETRRPLQRDGPPNRGLGRASDQGGFPLRRGAALPDPRPRRGLWRMLPRMSGEYGYRGSADRAAVAVAESLRRAVDRLDPPRVSGSRDRVR